jgi:hypothetical protein
MDMELATKPNGQHQSQRRETSLVGVQATNTDRIKSPDQMTKIQEEGSKQRRQGSEEEVGQGDFAMDLESMSASLKKKSLKSKAAKKKADKKKQEDSAEETTRRKKKAMFVP